MKQVAQRFHSPRVIAGILLLALVLRLFFLWKDWDNLEFAPSFLLHAEIARNILNGHWLEKNNAYLTEYLQACYDQNRLIDPEDFPPPSEEQLTAVFNDEGGYGMLLAILWKLFGSHRWWYVRVLQVLLDTLMCWLIYRIGSTVFHERVGLVGAFFYACFIPGIELAVRPHRDIWVTVLFIFTVYFLTHRLRGKQHYLWYIAFGLCAGVVAWMRSTVVPFVLFAVVALAFVLTWKDFLRLSAIMLGTFLLVFSPLVLRNYLVFDKIMLTRGAFWHSFWAGVGQFPNPYGIHEDDDEIAGLAKKLDPSVQFETERYELVLKKEALTFLSENPSWYIGSVVKRGFSFVFPKLGRAVFFQHTPKRHVTGILNQTLNQTMLVSFDIILSFLFLCGIWFYKNRWKGLLLLLLPYLYSLIMLSPFYFSGRNIMNVYFVILLFVSAAIVWIWERNRVSSSESSHH